MPSRSTRRPAKSHDREPFRLVMPQDDFQHEPDPTEREWEENLWVGFFVPEQQLSCFLLLQTFANLDLAALGVWVFDDTANRPRSFLYARHDPRLPGRQQSTVEIEVDGRLVLSTIEDLKTFRVRYHDGQELDLDVELVATRPPRQSATSGHGRIRQALWATGVIHLSGRSIEVAGAAIRSRKWGAAAPRPVATHYVYGIGPEIEFHALWTTNSDAQAQFIEGRISYPDREVTVNQGTRVVLERLGDYPLDIRLGFQTEDGATLAVSGITVNAGDFQPWANQHAVLCLTQWTIEGIEVWGNDAAISTTRPVGTSLASSAVSHREQAGTTQAKRLWLIPDLPEP